MSKPERSPTDETIGNMAAALSESTRYLVDKAESFNRSDVQRLERLVLILTVLNVAQLVIGIAFGVVAYAWVQDLLGSHNATAQHASEALVSAKMTEQKLDKFKAQQIEFNKQIVKALEEE